MHHHPLPTIDLPTLPSRLVLGPLAWPGGIGLLCPGCCHQILYGDGGHYRFSFRDPPDFEVAADVLANHRATVTMLRRFPSVVNSCAVQTGESIMQRAVRLHSNGILRDLLLCQSNRQLGLIRDKSGFTAFKIALLLEKRKSAQMLLDAVVAGRLSTMPASLAGIVECFPLLNRTFPELLLDLVCNMPLEKEPELLNVGAGPLNAKQTTSVFALMPRGQKMLVRGSQLRTEPKSLWRDVLDTDSNRKATWSDLRLGKGTREEVQALRVPFRGFVDYYPDCTQSPLYIITYAATKLNRLEVFEAPIVQAAIQFKWQSYARFLFMRQFFRFVVMLWVYFTFSISAAKTVEGPSNPLKFWFYKYDGGGGNTAISYARLATVLWPVCTFDSFLMFCQECKEIWREGVLLYCSSVWNILDFSTFSVQLAADFLFVFHENEELVRTLLAVSMLMLFSRTMYFARGFTLWGPLVRMITQICSDIRPFLIVLIIFLCGFTSAFHILNSERSEGDVPTSQYQNTWWGTLLFTVDSSVFNIVDRADTPLFSDQTYCSGDNDDSCEQSKPYGDLRKGTLLYLFEFMMFIVEVMLLNLLIAIMGDSYGKVHQYAKLEAMSERAKIILEAEVYWLNMSAKSRTFARRASSWTASFGSLLFSDGDYVSRRDFAVWLHILQAGGEDADMDDGTYPADAGPDVDRDGSGNMGGRKEEAQGLTVAGEVKAEGGGVGKAEMEGLQHWLTQQHARTDKRLAKIAKDQEETQKKVDELIEVIELLTTTIHYDAGMRL